MIRKPDINDYPPWLQSYIQQPMARSVRAEEEYVIPDLLQVYHHTRIDPVCKVLFGITVEHIRRDFDIWALQEQIRALRFEHTNLLKMAMPFTPKEIAALKACAAQKMNEPTPEEEESWDEALDDQR